MKAKLDTYAVAYVDAMRNRLSALEPENKDLRARVAELEAREKRMEELRSKLEEEQEAHAWEISPAMAQAKIDELNAKVSTLEANGLELERTRLAARVAELEAENKDLRERAELADGDVKRAQAILDASNTYIRRIEVELQRESQAKIDAEFHVAALKERLAELEARTREAEESNANALARFSAAEATIELRRIENEAVRHQVWHAENVCDAMEKRVFDTDARCKRLEEAARAVYLDSIASDHPWTEPEARNMRALRDVLEAKP